MTPSQMSVLLCSDLGTDWQGPYLPLAIGTWVLGSSWVKDAHILATLAIVGLRHDECAQSMSVSLIIIGPSNCGHLLCVWHTCHLAYAS